MMLHSMMLIATALVSLQISNNPGFSARSLQAGQSRAVVRLQYMTPCSHIPGNAGNDRQPSLKSHSTFRRYSSALYMLHTSQCRTASCERLNTQNKLNYCMCQAAYKFCSCLLSAETWHIAAQARTRHCMQHAPALHLLSPYVHRFTCYSLVSALHHSLRCPHCPATFARLALPSLPCPVLAHASPL